MDEELRVFSRAKYQEDAEMCVVIVMAHGDEGKIFCVDGRIVSPLYLEITVFSRLTIQFLFSSLKLKISTKDSTIGIALH